MAHGGDGDRSREAITGQDDDPVLDELIAPKCHPILDLPLTGSIAKTAQRIVDLHTPPTSPQRPSIEAALRQAFLALVRIDESGKAVRKQVPLAELPEQVHSILQRFSGEQGRLLTISDNARLVEVSHEALFDAWPPLNRWIQESRGYLIQRRKVEASAAEWRAQGEPVGYLLQGQPLTEAVRLKARSPAITELSETATAYVEKSVEQRKRNQIKLLAWLLIPALAVVGIFDYALYEDRVKANYARLDQVGTYEETIAVEELVTGCGAWIFEGAYVTERLLGSCRSLAGAALSGAKLNAVQLNKANLTGADLSQAELNNAYLRNADLEKANLSHAHLQGAQLRNARLYSANLSEADLSPIKISVAGSSSYRPTDLRSANLRLSNFSGANLSSAILTDAELYLSTLTGTNLTNANLTGVEISTSDLTNANLTGADLTDAVLSRNQLVNTNFSDAILLNTDLHSFTLDDQNNRLPDPAALESDNPPFICNTFLPSHIDIDPNRDCDRLAETLVRRYASRFREIEDAERFINQQRKKQWK